ncbi:MAG: hypothetical protein AAF533_01945 [Acidobacteriota bacterium]
MERGELMVVRQLVAHWRTCVGLLRCETRQEVPATLAGFEEMAPRTKLALALCAIGFFVTCLGRGVAELGTLGWLGCALLALGLGLTCSLLSVSLRATTHWPAVVPPMPVLPLHVKHRAVVEAVVVIILGLVGSLPFALLWEVIAARVDAMQVAPEESSPLFELMYLPTGLGWRFGSLFVTAALMLPVQVAACFIGSEYRLATYTRALAVAFVVVGVARTVAPHSALLTLVLPLLLTPFVMKVVPRDRPARSQSSGSTWPPLPEPRRDGLPSVAALRRDSRDQIVRHLPAESALLLGMGAVSLWRGPGSEYVHFLTLPVLIFFLAFRGMKPALRTLSVGSGSRFPATGCAAWSWMPVVPRALCRAVDEEVWLPFILRAGVVLVGALLAALVAPGREGMASSAAQLGALILIMTMADCIATQQWVGESIASVGKLMGTCALGVVGVAFSLIAGAGLAWFPKVSLVLVAVALVAIVGLARQHSRSLLRALVPRSQERVG